MTITYSRNIPKIMQKIPAYNAAQTVVVLVLAVITAAVIVRLRVTS